MEVQTQLNENDVYKGLPMCKKIKVLTFKLCALCGENFTIPLMLAASTISKLYLLLFSTFWLLFISSFIGTEYVASADQAKIIYSNMMLVSVVLGVLGSPLMGYVVDNYNPKCVIPLAFGIRAAGVGLFMQIKDPSSIYAYAVGVLLVMGTVFEGLVADCLLLRLADERTRGILYGAGHAFGSIGTLVFSLVGGILYDRHGPYMPFIFVGVLDLGFAILAALLACCNVVKNDIAERKLTVLAKERLMIN